MLANIVCYQHRGSFCRQDSAWQAPCLWLISSAPDLCALDRWPHLITLISSKKKKLNHNHMGTGLVIKSWWAPKPDSGTCPHSFIWVRLFYVNNCHVYWSSWKEPVEVVCALDQWGCLWMFSGRFCPGVYNVSNWCKPQCRPLSGWLIRDHTLASKFLGISQEEIMCLGQGHLGYL